MISMDNLHDITINDKGEKHMNLKNKVLADYPSTTYDKIRYRDTDKQGHVNNAVFSQFFETGRVEILYSNDIPLYCDHCSFVIAAKNTDFIKEIIWPGEVEIGTGITKIGNSSLIMVQGLYQNNMLCATSETVVVQMDELTRKSYPLHEITKDTLTKLMMK